MGQARESCKTLPGDPPVELVLRRSARARRITLRVSSLDGRVTLSLPRGVSERAGLAFAEERSDWIRSHLSKRAPGRGVALGGVVPVLGAPREVVEGAPGLGPDVLRVRAARPVGPQVQAVVKEAARGALVAASGRYAAAIGRVPGRITLRDTRSRWGSCSWQGNLNYSWRLALAPFDVLDYVAAHEVAHLAHMDHSPAFWSVVTRLCPDWKAHRAWLRTHGGDLHAWQFG
ncbi:M48 family metallopeptidase [Maribius pontilimi]|uniref:M48 family metallopeptidase n=1 Tax=Palleronia pontilimi TaxID=1964209 RepID=A0A934ID78_9RHOB|nr:SprT family zinc-dependent metalloprotease [Palleronia pontilimi]MBJ3762307.1 M48 family metallopeptidase [Palleronia pontilimi]